MTIAKNNECDVAIIGIACRFPGAEDYHRYWENLATGINSIREIPSNRWDLSKFYSSDFTAPNKSISKWCGIVEDLDCFDYRFFNTSPHEAQYIDPQQRMLLEESWRCVEDSGVPLEELRSKKTAVIIGVMANDHLHKMADARIETSAYACLGNYECIIANRLSNYFALTGKSISINGACSSSAIAIHEGRKSLQLKESDYVLAGGVNLNIHPWKYVSFSKARMLSPDGQCKTFDQDANGYVPGDGIGVLLMQLKENAIEAGNHIYGIIKGSAVNHVGGTDSITAPDIEAQKSVILDAYSDAGISPDSVSYVEAHGTGTSLGDPIEIQAISQAFAEYTEKKSFCKIGSVKTNIGHLEASAGVAGVIKVLMMMQNQAIPPSLNVSILNPLIQFEQTPFTVVQNLEPWKPTSHEKGLRAGISSFGFGGANCHILLESYPESLPGKKLPDSNKATATAKSVYPFLLSARSLSSLELAVKKWMSYLESSDPNTLKIEEISSTLLHGRQHFNFRFASLVSDITEIKSALRGFEPKNSQVYKSLSLHINDVSGSVQVFADDARENTAFFSKISELKKQTGITGQPEKSETPVVDAFIQSYLYLADLLTAGFKPAHILASKEGFWLGLAISGIVSVQDAIKAQLGRQHIKTLKVKRPVIPILNPLANRLVRLYHIDHLYFEKLIESSFLDQKQIDGLLLFYKKLKSNQFTFKKYMEEWDKHLEKAGQAVDRLINETGDKVHVPELPRQSLLLFVILNSSLQRLHQKWSLPFNSGIQNMPFLELTDLIIDEVVTKRELVQLLLGDRSNKSTFYHEINERQHKLDPVKPYQILKACNTAIREIDDFQHWCESWLKGNPSIQGFEESNSCFFGRMTKEQNVISINPNTSSYQQSVERTLVDLWKNGAEIDWRKVTPVSKSKKVPLPTYQFEKHRLDFLGRPAFTNGPSEDSAKTPTSAPAPTIAIAAHENHANRYVATLKFEDWFVRDHVIDGKTVLPGAVSVEMLFTAFKKHSGRLPDIIESITWYKPVFFDADRTLNIDFETTGESSSFSIFSESDTGNKDIHVKGKLSSSRELPLKPAPVVPERIMNQHQAFLNKTAVYDAFQKAGYCYGPGFQVVESAYINDLETLAVLSISKDQELEHAFAVHPALLDGALQTAIIPLLEVATRQKHFYYPYFVEKLYCNHDVSEPKFAHITLTHPDQPADSDIVKCHVNVFNNKGNSYLHLRNLSFKKAVSKPVHAPDIELNLSTVLYGSAWLPSNDVSIKTLPNRSQKQHIIFFLPRISNDVDVFEIKRIARVFETGLPSIVVRPSNEYKQIDNTCFDIVPNNLSSYLSLLHTLARQGMVISDILHLWSYGVELSEAADLNELKTFSINSLFNLCKAISTVNPEQHVNILYCYHKSWAALNPIPAALSGFFKSVGLENSGIHGRVLAIGSHEHDKGKLPKLELLKKEFDYHLPAGTETTLNNNERRLFAYQQTSFADQNRYRLSIRENGTYLITGGLGGIGVIISEYLLSQSRVNLILTCRSEASNDQLKELTAGNQNTSKITYLKSDIASQQGVDELISHLDKDNQSLNGIFHCAGVTHDATLHNKELSDVNRVIGSKVDGTLYLDEASKNEPLDFFILFSSTTAVFGNIGQCDYAFANRFLDYYAPYREELRQRGERSGSTISINWPVWKDGGMQISESIKKQFFNLFGIVPLNTNEAIKTLETAFVAPFQNLLVVSGDQDKITRDLTIYQKEEMTIAKQESDKRPKPDDQSYLQLFQDEFTAIAASQLHLDASAIDIHEDMSDFGFDSISFTDITNALNDKFEIGLAPTIFFEKKTLARIVDAIWEDYREELLHYYGKTDDLNKKEFETIAKTDDMEIKESGSSIPPKTGNGVHKTNIIAGNPKAIAIIGMNGKLPGSDNLEEFWEHLESGNDLISEIPGDRWNWSDYHGDPREEENKTNIKWGGFMRDVACFDAPFFKISAREAELMDPQQRILLECVWNTIEDAGYNIDSLSGSATGVFIASAFTDYDELLWDHSVKIEAHMATGSANSILANRISYQFNFHGPSENIDTACSGSLVAIYRGVESIRNGSCDQVIAGGANLLLSPSVYIAFNKTGMLSTDGRCKTFDHKANGYVRGEGIGTLLLKSLEKAEQDGDYIYAIILGGAVNHGGHTNTLTTPNPESQTNLIKAAYQDAGVPLTSISYIETHGTGTPLGDPIELKALQNAFADSGFESQDSGAFCGIGSLKTNIGHLEAAAGVAGVLKILLSLKNKTLPAHIHFEKINPYIDLEKSPLYIVQKTESWQRIKDNDGNEIARRAGISSFGFGGTNAHLVIEEYENENTNPAIEKNELEVFLLSAESREQLLGYANKYIDFLENLSRQPATKQAEQFFKNLVFTLQKGRRVMNERLAIVASNPDDLTKGLRQFIENKTSKNLFLGNAESKRKELDTLFEGDVGAEIVRVIVEKRDLKKLCQLWVSGLDIDFSPVRQNAHRKRVPLPTYPFAKHRYWIEATVTKKEEDSVKPATPINNHSLPKHRSICYLPVWRPTPLKGEGTPRIVKSIVVIYRRGDEELVEHLKAAHPQDSFIEILLGKSFSHHHNQKFEVEAANPDFDKIYSHQIDVPDLIYYIESPLPGQSLSATHKSQTEQVCKSVIQPFLALIKFLEKRQKHPKSVAVKLITVNALHLWPGDEINPAGSALHGFARAADKDCENIDICSLDISKKEIDNQLASKVITEPLIEGVRDVTYRNDVRYQRYLTPIKLNSPGSHPYRERGVYIILGGFGNLGFKTALHLAQHYNARLAIIGRRETDEQTNYLLNILNQQSGEAIYIQADISSTEELAQALDVTKKHFGEINGVIHTAMNYDETPFGELTNDTIRTMFRPKIDGVINLLNECRHEKLDFIHFFSSAQVFSGAKKRAHYAAACSYADAYVQTISRTVPFDLKIINWGFWHRPNNDENKQAFAASLSDQGIFCLQENEVLALSDQFCAQSSPQVAIFDVSDSLLELMGVRSDYSLSLLPQGALPTLKPGILSFSEADHEAKLSVDTEAIKHITGFMNDLLLNALDKLGLYATAGEKIPLESIERKYGLQPHYSRLLHYILDYLNELGFIIKKSDFIEICGSAVKKGEYLDIARNADQVKTQLAGQYPEYRPFLTVIHRVLSQYDELLTGMLSPIDLFFSSEAKGIIERIYRDNLIADFHNDKVLKLVRTYIGKRLLTLKSGEKINILEIGSGTGGTSIPVIESIAEFSADVRFSFTDISQSFLNNARTILEKPYPFVDYKILDIEQNIKHQDFQVGQYDLVFASNVLHATRDIRNSLGNAKQLLKNNGWLILNEVTKVQPFVSLSFGILEGWWRFEDSDCRLKNSPLLDIKRWKNLMRETGFKSIETAVKPEYTENDLLSQTVIIGESNGVIRDEADVAQVTATIPQQKPLSKQAVWKHAGQPNLQGEIIHIISQVLKVNPDEIKLEASFQRLGFDSILALEMTELLSKRYGVKLKPTELIEHTSINEFISGFKPLDSEHAGFDDPPTNELEIVSDYKPEAVIMRTKSKPQEPVAIIGLSGVFPGAEDVSEFWKNLAKGKASIAHYPSHRSNHLFEDLKEKFLEEGKDIFWGGFLSDVSTFDHDFFAISPREARVMDPQQRIILETAWKTIEDAGYRASDLSGSKTGVFVGIGKPDYYDLIRNSENGFDSHTLTGISTNLTAARISHLLRFQGPCEIVDAACAGSSIAIHKAVEAIRSGSCNAALAGGINLMMAPYNFLNLQQTGLLADKGQVRIFDKNSDGFVRSESSAIIMLKPLSQAISDRDNIYGLIRGTAASFGAQNEFLTKPDEKTQSEVIRQAIRNAGLTPDQIDYIEAHGSGNSIGNTIEINAFKNVFLTDSINRTRRSVLRIGSLKANIGHAEAASGIVGLIKVLGSFQNSKLPPTLGCELIDPDLDLKSESIEILTQPLDLTSQQRDKASSAPYRAGIHSFGFGVFNSHLVVEDYVGQSEESHEGNAVKQPELFVFSARTAESLKQYLQIFKRFLDSNPKLNLGNVAYTLQMGREPMEERLAVVTSCQQELGEIIEAILSGQAIDSSKAIMGRVHIPETPDSLFPRQTIVSSCGKTQLDIKQLERMARDWIEGETVNWNLLHHQRKPSRVSLPTVCFKKQKHWIEIRRKSAAMGSEYASQALKRQQSLKSTLTELVKEALARPDLDLQGDEKLRRYGFDSLMLISVVNSLSIKTDYNPFLKSLAKASTINEMVDILDNQKPEPGNTNTAQKHLAEDEVYYAILRNLEQGKILPDQAISLKNRLLSEYSG